ncbi:hypothetical protein M0805_003573 [Coniferiporia weirii]|nr:hypothetical protein M0805_003573 [Coniferiporia weirii]
MRSLFALTALVAHALVVSGQTWCGKHYMQGSSVVAPGGEFPIPATSKEPLLAFRCAPAVKPYLADDESGIFIIDALVTNSEIAGAIQLDSRNRNSKDDLSVTVSVNGRTLASGKVPLNTSAHELDFSLKELSPRTSAYEMTCTATLNGQTFHATSPLQRLPNPKNGGGVTKMDGRTGAMLVQGKKSGEWDTLFPIGFYTSFDGYLSTNLSVLNDLEDRGFTIVHPVPTFDNMTALDEVVDRMEELGLYLIYDMRGTYMNLTSVTEQVNMFKNRKNLLIWYTGDEPDGTGDPLNATRLAYDLINELDGYHPVSLVLNCENYYFTDYTSGADVILEDAYPVSVNATFSAEWGTPCTIDYGCCGCDDCNGNYDDISTRLDEFTFRLNALGQTRSKAKWAVPQAFGGSEYWPRAPTGNEWLVESIVAINHGATGIVPWIDPTPQDIKDSATDLAKALTTIKTYLFDSTATFSSATQKGVDIGVWTVGQSTLVLATNMYNTTVSFSLDLPGASGTTSKPRSDSESQFYSNIKATQILNSGGSLQLDGSKNPAKLSLDALGSVGFVLEQSVGW